LRLEDGTHAGGNVDVAGVAALLRSFTMVMRLWTTSSAAAWASEGASTVAPG
jgi:hypothetical protein